jgi:ABC-type molybdate transport system substrate-binding protein
MARTYTSAVLVVAVLTILASAALAEDMLLFAAASLTNAMQQLGTWVVTKTGNNVSFSFGSSGTLARQIAAGAPAHVFFSADEFKTQQVEASRRIRKEQVRNLLSNRFVVIVPADSTVTISAASDLNILASILTIPSPYQWVSTQKRGSNRFTCGILSLSALSPRSTLGRTRRGRNAVGKGGNRTCDKCHHFRKGEGRIRRA